MKLVVVAAALLVASAPLQAQMVVTRDTLDANLRDLRDTLVILDDSLHTVQAALAQLQLGHAGASKELLFSRGKSIKNACSSALRNVAPARNVVKEDDWDTDHRTRQQTQLLGAMDDLEQSLSSCESVWGRLATIENAEEIRTAGPHEATSISDHIERYSRVVAGYYKVLGIYVPPAGMSRDPAP